MHFHYIAVEGPTGVGKTSVVERLAERLDATTVLEEGTENPFLKAFYDSKPGAAFQVELFYLLSRYRQQQDLVQRNLFTQATISDYILEKSKLFAYLTLEDSELLIFERLYSVLVENVPRPDLVVYLQAPADVLQERIARRGIRYEQAMEREYLERLVDAYTRFFHLYDAGPLLIVNAAEVDFVGNEAHFAQLEAEVGRPRRGRHYFNPFRG